MCLAAGDCARAYLDFLVLVEVCSRRFLYFGLDGVYLLRMLYSSCFVGCTLDPLEFKVKIMRELKLEDANRRHLHAKPGSYTKRPNCSLVRAWLGHAIYKKYVLLERSEISAHSMKISRFEYPEPPEHWSFQLVA